MVAFVNIENSCVLQNENEDVGFGYRSWKYFNTTWISFQHDHWIIIQYDLDLYVDVEYLGT